MTVQELKQAIRLDGLSFDGGIRRLQQFTEGLAEAMELLEEVEQYRALGAVEELKEAREKQVAKKPIRKHINTIRDSYVCPTCGTEWLFGKVPKYCGICGQKLGEEGGTSD